MTLPAPELAAIYRRGTANRGVDCPAGEVFALSSTGRLGPEERRALAVHLGRCSGCAEEYRLVQDVHAAELASARSERASGLSGLSLAARLAAVLVLGASLGAVLLGRERREVEAWRGTGEVAAAVAPADGATLAAAPELLSWPAAPDAESYVVTLYDAEATVVWRSLPSRAPTVRLPDDVRRRLGSGVVYWRVVAETAVERRPSPLHRLVISR